MCIRDRLNTARMETVIDDTVLATDIADYLVMRGVPFRTSHEIVGAVITDVIKRGVLLRDLSVQDFQGYSPVFKKDILEIINLSKSIDRKRTLGSTSRASVSRQIKKARRILQISGQCADTKSR